jgi:ABC-type transport system substrate-binding protein
MKRSLLLIILALVAIGGLLATSCGGTATTTTAPTTTAPATTAPATTKPATTAPSTTAPATTAPATTTAQPYGTIRIASGTQSGFTYESVDPNNWETFWGWSMYDPLITFDAQGNFVGVVADSWTLSPDGKTYTFKIHKGITFQNGDPLTAADVKFSVDRFAQNQPASTNPWSPYLARNIDSTSTPDDYTFVYNMKTPEPMLLVPFTYVRILPKNYFNKVGQDGFRAAPIGSGPYKFVSMVHSVSCTLEANTKYWGTPKPQYKTIIDLLVPEEATRVAMLKSGDADIATSLSPDRIVELRKLGYRLENYGLSTLYNISFPGTWETTSPTKDIRVRQAMSYSINRQEMCDTFYKGLAVPGGRWFIDPTGWGWDPSWKPDPYDLAKAKQLLKDANYPAAFADPVIQIYAQTGSQADFVQVLKGYWDAAGIQTKINIVDSVTYAGMFFTGSRAPTAKNVGAIIPWVYPTYANSVYHSANMYTPTGVHGTGGPNDTKAQELYNKAVSDLDLAQAKADFTAFQNYAYSMWVNVGTIEMPTYCAVGPNLGKFTSYYAEGIYYILSGIQHPAGK